jgi:hypothetical protein
MRRILAAVALVAATAASAQTVRFDPPAPTSQTPVSVTISGLWGDGCPPRGATATLLTENRIVVALQVSQIPCPIIPVRAVEYRVSAFIGLLPAGVYQLEARVLNSNLPVVATRQLVVREAAPALTVLPRVIFSDFNPVRIHAPGMGTCPPNVSPCITPRVTVTFNGVASPSVRIASPDDIDAFVPQITANGPINVVVTTDDGRRLESKAALFLTSDRGLVDESLFERILIPVLSEGPGAFGAQWTTDAFVENASAHNVPFFRAPFPTPPCASPRECDFAPIPAGTTRRIDPSYPTGIFLYPERGSDIRLNVLVRDLSRQSEALGAEVPVIREDDWKEGEISLLNVPSDSRFRVSLRVYIEEETQAFLAVPLRIYRMNSATPLVDTFMSLDRAHNGLIPATGFIGDLAANFAIPTGEPLRIEVGQPATGEKFFAFASVTNNATQHVTIMSPQ